MDQDSLVMEGKDAGSELVKKFHKSMPVEVAFWIKSSDEDRWTLCIVSEKIDEKTFDLGYGEVLRIAREMRSPYIDPLQIRLLRSDDPLAKAALTVLRRFPGNSPTRIRGEMFGVPNVEMAYVYPASVVAD